MKFAELTEIPEDIKDAANHGLLYPNVLQPAWERHAEKCFDSGADVREKTIINKLKRAIKSYENQPEQLADWLAGFCKQQ